MAEAISNTSPLLYLFRIGVMSWLPGLFQDVWTPPAVAAELEEGQRAGYDVPRLLDYDWLKISADVKQRVLVLAGEEATGSDSGSP